MPEKLLKKLLNELVVDWSKANFQYNLVAAAEQKKVLSLFSPEPVYKFSEYAQQNQWTPEDILQANPPETHTYFEYCYNADHTPVLVKKYYNGIVGDIGVFIWEKHLWKYIEFNVLNLVCTAYCSISFKEGKKSLFKYLRLNAGAFNEGINNRSADELALQLSGEPYSYFAEINSYNYENDVITTSDYLSNLPGTGDYFTTNFYSYDAIGSLYKIVARNTQQENQVIYIALSDRSVNDLIKSVAMQMAEYLAACIIELATKRKLSCIIISYQYCFTYWPSLSFVSEAEMLDDVNNKAAIFPMGDFYTTTDLRKNIPEKLLDNYAELEQHISQKDQHELGRIMLLETSKILRVSLPKTSIAVTKDFIVFPIDWTLHSPPEVNLLTECGASAKQIKLWTKLGWTEQ